MMVARLGDATLVVASNNTKHLCQKFNKHKKYKHTQWCALEIHLKSHIKRLYHKHEII